jgi:hypothetical protein
LQATLEALVLLVHYLLEPQGLQEYFSEERFPAGLSPPVYRVA